MHDEKFLFCFLSYNYVCFDVFSTMFRGNYQDFKEL